MGLRGVLMLLMGGGLGMFESITSMDIRIILTVVPEQIPDSSRQSLV